MPLSYIVLLLMKILKEHKKQTILLKKQISKVISEFFAEAPIPEEVKASLLEDFDFDYDLEILIDNFGGYFTLEGDHILFSPSITIDTLDELIEDEKINYDEELIDIIDDFFEFNVEIFDIIGIQIEKELYDNILNLERDIEESYDELARIEMSGDIISKKTLYNLKKNVLKRNIVFSQIKHSLTLEEYNDLYMYATYKYNLTNIDTLTPKIDNEEFDYVMEEDPFHRALFFIDTNKEIVLANKFYVGNDYQLEEELTKEKFYMNVLDTIDSRINKKEHDDLDDDLILAKYRLIYTLDSIYEREGKYNNYLFMGNKEDIVLEDEDYSFIKREIYFLIDEILEYTDKEMVNDYLVNFQNIIKSILIETYYNMTKDDIVIDMIVNHPNYKKDHFISELFDNMIYKSKKKIKRKEEE